MNLAKKAERIQELLENLVPYERLITPYMNWMSGRESGQLTCDLKDVVWKALNLQNHGVTPEEKERIMELAELLQLVHELIQEYPPIEEKAGKFEEITELYEKLKSIVR